MITVKTLKPYYIIANQNQIQVVLAYQYFSVFVNKQVYQFIPVKSNEIRINRTTKQIENRKATFAFQKGKEIIYMTMTELISLPDFLFQLHAIAAPYFQTTKESESVDSVIAELEQRNLKCLIDQALDNRDKEAFMELSKQFKT